MPFTLTIRFEGLFTFVVRRNAPSSADRGVYVLMAGDHPHHPHPGHVPHFWSIEYNGTTLKNLKHDMNLRDLPGNAWSHGKADRITHLLPYSRTSKGPVDGALLTPSVNFPHADLHGRVVLPLHEDVRHCNEVGVEWATPQGTWLPLRYKVTGVTILTFKVSGSVAIPGLPQPINSAGTVTMKYVPLGNPSGSHKKHDKLGHAGQHGAVFGNKPQDFRIDDNYQAGPCPEDGLMKSAHPQSFVSVDPVLCTNAGGCPPEDLGCNNCPPEDPNCGEG
jgi:hypothetical protein